MLLNENASVRNYNVFNVINECQTAYVNLFVKGFLYFTLILNQHYTAFYCSCSQTFPIIQYNNVYNSLPTNVLIEKSTNFKQVLTNNFCESTTLINSEINTISFASETPAFFRILIPARQLIRSTSALVIGTLAKSSFLDIRASNVCVVVYRTTSAWVTTGNEDNIGDVDFILI
jgi:hypothetical protein